MITQHRFQITAQCPVDDTVDVYQVTVETSEVIPVEEILTAVAAATHEPRFQEEITRALAQLIAHVKVTTVGTHSGVETTCVCWSEVEAQ